MKNENGMEIIRKMNSIALQKLFIASNTLPRAPIRQITKSTIAPHLNIQRISPKSGLYTFD
jgi:hypothetical protein